MSLPPRWKDADQGDPFVRDLLRDAHPTRALPETNRARGARRVAKLVSVPVVGLGISLWAKAAGAGFAFGVASAITVALTAPGVRERIFGIDLSHPRPSEVAPSPREARVPEADGPASVDPPEVPAPASPERESLPPMPTVCVPQA